VLPGIRPPSVAARGRAGELGRRGEELAAELLRARGYTIVERNFRCRAGEIDLVALDGPTVVFVEVRSRRGERVGTPLESVDPRKQARLTLVARHFLHARRLDESSGAPGSRAGARGTLGLRRRSKEDHPWEPSTTS